MSNPTRLEVIAASSRGDTGTTGVTSWLHTVPNGPDRYLLVFVAWTNATSSISAGKFGEQDLSTIEQGMPYNPHRVGSLGSLQCLGLTAPNVGTYLISLSGTARTRCGQAISIIGHGNWVDPDATSGVNSTQGISIVGGLSGDLKIGCIYALTNPAPNSTSGTEILETIDASSRYLNSQYGYCRSSTDNNLAWTKSSGSGVAQVISLRYVSNPYNRVIS